MEVLKVREFLSVQQVSKLIGCSRQTVYELINSGKLHAVNLKEKKTIVRRSDIDRLFDRPFVRTPKKEPQPVSEFYTAKEIEEKYFVKYGRLNSIIKENDIPKTVHNGKLLVSKPHIDRYFKQTRSDVSSIIDWYTVEEIQHKYSISRDQIYGRVYDNNIPKQRVGKYVKISKRHFDELFEIGV
ncbi:helix-turn-helix domain-containing protein [Runella slithyformis]|nr:helix-turn-helix domain-containing protein [Runella slithyformis]